MAVRSSETWFKTRDGAELFLRTWQPPEGVSTVAVVQIHHGLAEHSARYQRFAEVLCRSGFAVLCHDARAHGKTAQKANPPGLGSFNFNPAIAGEMSPPLIDSSDRRTAPGKAKPVAMTDLVSQSIGSRS